MRAFERTSPDHILFGVGAEARTAALLERHGARRVLIVAQPNHRGGAERVAASLGARCVGIFDGVTTQVPEDVADAATAAARAREADWVVAHGGGSTVGVAKVVALSMDVRVAAVPTTFAGSERTEIWGLMARGEKRTGRDEWVRPRLVVYDPRLVIGLPRLLSLQSLLNAMAHSVEALYAEHATDAARNAARESLRPLLRAIEGVAADPAQLEARTEGLYGAYLAAEALNGAAMALHHKLAHVLGGSFGTPHAATHATLLPHTLGFNAPAAPDAMAALREAWSTDDPPGFLFDRMQAMGLPTALREIGVLEAELQRLSILACERSYPNPRPIDVPAMRALLDSAWHGGRPGRS